SDAIVDGGRRGGGRRGGRRLRGCRLWSRRSGDDRTERASGGRGRRGVRGERLGRRGGTRRDRHRFRRGCRRRAGRRWCDRRGVCRSGALGIARSARRRRRDHGLREWFAERPCGGLAWPLAAVLGGVGVPITEEVHVEIEALEGRSSWGWSPRGRRRRWGVGAMGNAVWRGVRLKDVLGRVGVK